VEVNSMSRYELFVELAAVLRRAGWDPAEAARRALLAMGPGPQAEEVDLGGPGEATTRSSLVWQETVVV
jgi:hypothetical protein